MDTEESPTAYNGALLWLGRLTKTDVAYVASGGFWLGASQMGIGLIAFGVSIAFAHFVSKDVYGTYRFLLASFWTLTAFTMSGITSSMARAVARGAEGTYRQSFPLFIMGCLPMTAIALGGSLYYYLNQNLLLSFGMLLIALLGTLFQPSYLFGSFLEGKRAFKMNAASGIVVSIVPALALLMTMFFSENPLVFFAVYLLSNVLTGAALSIFMYTFYRPNEVKDPGLLNLSFHMSANNFLATIAGRIDELLLFHFLGPASVATYSFATALPNQVKNLANAVANIAFPKFAARPIHEIIPTLSYRMYLFTLALAGTTALYWLAAPILFSIFFPTYTNSIWYSQLFALALIPVASIIPQTLLEAHAAKKQLYILNTVGPIMQIGTLFFLITFYGLFGAVIARIVSRLFSLVLSVVLVGSYAKEPVT